MSETGSGLCTGTAATSKPLGQTTSRLQLWAAARSPRRASSGDLRRKAAKAVALGHLRLCAANAAVPFGG